MKDEGASDQPVSLASRAITAAHWRFAAAITAVGLRFGVGVLLARLLPPADFGIVALAFVVIAFAQPLSDFGIAAAVMQRPDLTNRHLRVATTLSIALGILITLTLAVSAPRLATLTGDLRVDPVLRTLAVTFAIQGVGVVAGAILKRRLEFRQLFFVDIFSYVIGYGVVAIAMAVAGFGLWSLVAAAIVQSALASVLLIVHVRPPMRPLLVRQEARELLHVGIGSGANSWVNYFAVNGDNFVVGRMLGAADLGLYSRAYNLMNLPYTHAASVMSGVLFPAFAQIQRERARLGRAYLTMTGLTALIAAPSMCLLAIVAPDLVIGLYGDRWAGVVLPLQILCVAGYFRALYHVGGIVAQSVGRVYSELWRQVGYACLVIVGAFVGSRYGLQGVAVGVGIAILYMFFATGQLALEIIKAPWREYVEVQRDAILIATFTAAAAFVARLALQRAGAQPLVIALGAIAAACVPWAFGAVWKLGSPELAILVPHLPRFARRLVEKLGSFQPNR